METIDPNSDKPTQASTDSRPGEDARTSWIQDVAALCLFCSVVFFVLLGYRELSNPDEGRYAEIPREMVASGDWVLPRLNGVVYFEKPPLVYWMVAASQSLPGDQEWVSRLTPALFASLGVILVYLTGRRLFGRREGMLAALMLGSSALYAALGRMLLLDMVLSVLISAVLCFFLFGIREPPGRRRRGFFWGLYVCAALATLAKGLIGFLVPGAIIFLWLLMGNHWRRLRPFHLPTGAAIFLAIAAPWHVLAALRNPDWAYFYFVHEQWLRYTSEIHDRAQPWWFFLPIIAVGFFPWVGLLGSALRSLWLGRARIDEEGSMVSFLLIWAGFIVVFFSISNSKLVPYILPVFPPLALLTGRWCTRAFERPRVAVGLIVYSVIGLTLAVGVLVVLWKGEGLVSPERLARARPFIFAVAASLGCGVVVTAFGKWRLSPSVIGVVLATMVIANLSLDPLAAHVTTPATKSLARYVRDHMEPGDTVYHYGGFSYDFAYYAAMDVGTVDFTGELELQIDPEARASGRFIDGHEFRRQWAGPGRVWMLVRQKWSKDLLAEPAFTGRIVAESPGFMLLLNQKLPSEVPLPDHEVIANREF